MFRKQTRPKIVDMPRRKPTFQVFSGHKATPQISLRQPEHPVPTPLPKTVAEMPKQVLLSSNAQEPFSLLREILQQGKTQDPEPEKHYSCRIPVIDEPRENRRPKFKTAFPGFKLHRLWKLQPGLYCLLRWEKASREVLLRHRDFVFRTSLPHGVMEPPAKTKTTYLEIGKPEDGQRLRRVSAKWVSI